MLTVLTTLTIINCKSIDRTCLGKVANVTNNATDIVEAVERGSEEEGNEAGVISAIVAAVAAFCPLLANGTFSIVDYSTFFYLTQHLTFAIFLCYLLSRSSLT